VTLQVIPDRLVPWLVRGLWVSLPFAAGPALADALDGASSGVRTLASGGLWVGWAAGMLASFVAHPVALTGLRVLAPSALAAVAGATLGGHESWVGLGCAAVSLVWVFDPAFALVCVNGPAYPNERRYPLRAPGPLLAGPLLVAWAVVVVGLASGPLLLAAHRWVAGGIAVAAGLPVALVLLRSLHALSRRWGVFVPAGFVLHDPLTLADPVLFRRQWIDVLRPAPADSDSLDLTQRAPGLALELVLTEKAELTLVRPGRGLGETGRTARLLFTPTRPGRVLADARARRIPVG
jgi:hypothetical protein